MKQTEHFWMICCHGLQVYRRTSENKINSQQAARAAYSCQGTLYGAFTQFLSIYTFFIQNNSTQSQGWNLNLQSGI
ncbi:MAG: hypothetical protein PUF03_04870, partial [Lachnospiraceae bacterium]|nr:hypothetical protein [Lachnospiraceae bacterium]